MTTPPPHRPTATAAGGRGATGPESSAGPPAGIGADRIRVAADAPRPGGFVRTAAAADLETMGRVHASTMLASLSAAHADAHNGAGLPASVTAMIAAPVIAAGWEQAVTRPPSPAHHVLVATQDGQVVGLTALAPARPAGPDGAAETLGTDDRDPRAGAVDAIPSAVEIVALGVEVPHQRQGHGSRLLAAAADHARADGATALLVWAVRGDESLARFLDTAGLRPTGSRRELPVGRGVIEDCWAATF